MSIETTEPTTETEPPTPENPSISEAIRQRFMGGEWLNPKQIGEEYGCSPSLVSYLVGRQEDTAGWVFESKRQGVMQWYRLVRIDPEYKGPTARIKRAEPVFKKFVPMRDVPRLANGEFMCLCRNPECDLRGFCHCGCGIKTNLYMRTDHTRGKYGVKGHPHLFAKNHRVFRDGTPSWLLGDDNNEDVTKPKSPDTERKKPVMQQPKGVDPSELVDSVPTEQLADAIAQALWARYERAISEIGRLQNVLQAKNEEIAKMELMLSAMGKPSASDVAKVMLGASNPG